MEQNEIVKKIITIENDIVTLYKKNKELIERITSQENLITVIHQLTLEITNLSKDIEYIKEGQDLMKSDIEEFKSKPKKYMDVIIAGVISAIIGGAITFLFIRLGMR